MYNGSLDIEFTDGVKFKYEVEDLIYELDKKEPLQKLILWNGKFKKRPIVTFKENIFEEKLMYDVLQDFYKYGFVIFKNVPTEDNYVLKFANSMGTVRPTNFGESFSVKSIPKPNDLAYTSFALTPHTDNPYRKPIPGIQLLHCIKNDSKGGNSTLTDGFAVSEYLKKKYPLYFKILSSVKIRFTYQNENTFLKFIINLFNSSKSPISSLEI